MRINVHNRQCGLYLDYLFKPLDYLFKTLLMQIENIVYFLVLIYLKAY